MNYFSPLHPVKNKNMNDYNENKFIPKIFYSENLNEEDLPTFIAIGFYDYPTKIEDNLFLEKKRCMSSYFENKMDFLKYCKTKNCNTFHIYSLDKIYNDEEISQIIEQIVKSYTKSN